MKFSLFPREGKFFDLLEAQSTKTLAAAELLNGIFSEGASIADKCATINQIESEGNALCREIVRQLSLTFITPLDKEDIHEINQVQEEILNLIKRISSRIGLYGFSTIRDPARWLVADFKSMVEEAEGMIGKLSTRNEIEAHIERIKKLKEKADLHLLVALNELYEEDLSGPDLILDTFKWTQIYDRIEEALNRVQYLAYTIEGVVLKYA